MTRILNSIHKAEQKFDHAAEHFFYRHPFLGYLIVFIGTPLIILAAVFLCTTILALPVAWASGWL